MKKGMTLIELLVTSLILSFGMASLLYSFVTCHKIILQNAHNQNAMLIINEHFEAVQNRESPASALTYIAQFTEPQKVTTTLNTGIDQVYYISMRTGANVEPFPGEFLNTVEATVTWNGGGPVNTLSLAMVTNEPELTILPPP